MTETRFQGARRRPLEIELKYRLASVVAGERYLVLDEIAGFRPTSHVRTTQLEDRYLDTKDGLLARAGFAARLRGSASGTIVTVKSTARLGPGGGAHRREEVEGPADRTAGPADWAASDARSLILELCGDAPLVELVTVRQLRRTRELRDRATLLELSLDEVDVVARSRILERFAELEVELVKGDEGRLEALADALQADVALSESRGSKLETALAAVRRLKVAKGPRSDARLLQDDDLQRLTETAGDRNSDGPALEEAEAPVQRPPMPSSPATPEPPGPTAEAPPGPEPRAAPGARSPARPARPRLPVPAGPQVTADLPFAEAGRRIAEIHLARMLDVEASVREDDSGAIDAALDAARGLLAAFDVFGAWLPGQLVPRSRDPLVAIADRLATVRDAEAGVDCLEQHRVMVSPAERAALEPLADALRAGADDATAILVRELDSARFAEIVDDLAVFARSPRVAGHWAPAHEPRLVREVAPAEIWLAYGRLRAAADALRSTAPDELDPLADAVAGFATRLEFFSEVLGDGSHTLVGRLDDLDEPLRRLRVARRASAGARAFARDRSGATGPEARAVARFVAAQAQEVASVHRALAGPSRAVTAAAFRRTLGRLVAAI